MSPDETVKVLATARAAYPGMSMVEGMPQVWHGALGDLRLAECQDAIVAHAKASSQIVTPADIRRLVQAARTDAALRSLPSGADDRVPMPDWFATTMTEFRSRARAAREQSRERGAPVSFGDAILSALDRRL